MGVPPAILVVDDGELGDVRQVLESIGSEYVYLRGGATEGVALALPTRLLIATARQAVRVAPAPDRAAQPVRIVVAEEDSNALRDQLRDGGFDYLVRRPVHPGALRLLILRALYRGPERRVAVRYPIGGPVAYRTGLRKKTATLLEIALRGCRLQAPQWLDPDTRVTVVLPKEFTQERAVSLPGWVLRCEPVREGDPDAAEFAFEAAIVFEGLKGGVERQLRDVLRRKMHEPTAGASAPPEVDAEGAGERDRRGGRRGQYRRPVVAVQETGQRVLVGRNLSAGGMLVEQNLELSVGDEAQLSIFGRDGEEPISVRGRVVREDANGMALTFVDVSPTDAERLERLVAALPSVERLADTEAEAMGTVVAEIVAGRSPGRDG